MRFFNKIQIVGYTPASPDPSKIIPTPTSAVLALGSVIVVDDVMLANNSTQSEVLARIEGSCIALNEPTLEELGQGIFPKVYCDIVYDFGAQCENPYECEDIIHVVGTLVFNNDADTDGVSVITGGTGKYNGVSGEVITKDPANFNGEFAQQNFHLMFPDEAPGVSGCFQHFGWQVLAMVGGLVVTGGYGAFL